MSNPEKVTLRTVRVMYISTIVLKPLVWIFDSIANGIFRLFNIKAVREDNLTSADIVAVDAGAEVGIKSSRTLSD